MRSRHELLIGMALLGVSSFAVYACGGTGTGPKMPTKSGRAVSVAKNSADDHSRCDFKGRADREVSETAGPGAIQPNIRRVYAIVGEGEDRHKNLLCREVDTNLDGMKDVVRTYNDKGEPLHELADSNYDGKIDTWETFARGRIAKVEIDTNHDGQPDEVRYYVDGKLSRIQRDTNHDGKPDVWEIYDKGHLRRMGVDLDHDGHVDRWNRDEIAAREQELKEEQEDEKADGGAGDAGPPPLAAGDAGAAAAGDAASKTKSK
jgi:hypothetical protein